MKTKKTYFAFRVLLGLLLALPAVMHGSAKTSVTLDDTAGVSSDGLGAYVNGQQGVGAMISSAGDLLVTFYNGARSLKINYANPVDPSNAPFSGVHVVNATAISSCCDVITVRDILTIPIGATALRDGYLMVQNPYIDPAGVPHVVTQNWNTRDVSGLLFSVTRTMNNQWIVQSQSIVNGDQTALKFFHNTGTTWAFESAAYYYIPIRMTINR